MEDYKERYLMVWANCMSPCNCVAGLYLEGTCDVISVTMKVHKNVHYGKPIVAIFKISIQFQFNEIQFQFNENSISIQ